jgi:SAM-dependent methyltransferase
LLASRLENSRLARAALRRMPAPARRGIFRGHARCCPVCESELSRFLPFGRSGRADAYCPVCESLERHRLHWIYLRERTDLLDGSPRRWLHVAPEAVLAARLRALPGARYVSADLADPRAMLRLDVMRLPFAEAAFDAIVCSHVLEHVADDRAAMRELRRVLRPGGVALLPVPPIRAERTTEDPAERDPAERRRRFGHPDHVRRYGRDYPQRLADAGFRVEAVGAAELVGDGGVRRFGLANGDEVFACRS